MCNSTDKCILCLKEIGNLQIKDDYSLKELNGAFPELDITDLKDPFQICFKCRRKLDVFSQFKSFLTQSFYQRRKHIQTLHNSCEARSFGELKIELNDRDIKKVDAIFPNTSKVKPCEIYIKQEIETQKACDSPILSNIQTIKDEKFIKIRTNTNFKCTVCNKIFLCTSSLKNHMAFHKGNKQFQCATCNKIFSHKGTLKKHVTIHTDFKIRCSICGKIFPCQSKLKRHMYIHSCLKRFECSICSKKFKHLEYLSNHMLTHSKTIECPVCNKMFSRNTNFIAHMTIHTGMQNYECTICNKNFSMKHHLLSHAVLHTGFKFECSICDKKYSTKAYLNKHMAGHTC